MEKLYAHQHFTLQYCHSAISSVEVVSRELLRASHALLSEFQIPTKEWGI